MIPYQLNGYNKKSQIITSVGEEVEKLEPSHIAKENIKNGTATLLVLQKVKHRVTV